MSTVLDQSKPNQECTCPTCVKACSVKPGWFLPGEVLEAAALLGMEPQAFFDTYLMVDYYEGGDNIYVLSPAIVGDEPGGMYPSDPHGTCVFLKEGRCSIHAAKPYECRALDHAEDDLTNRHELVAEAWKDHQDEVTGYYPNPEPQGEYYGGGMFGSMFGSLFDYDLDYLTDEAEEDVA